MAAYLVLASYRDTYSIVPGSYIDEIETDHPGWIDAKLAMWSQWLDARLSKRYVTPFSVPYPLIICGWLARMLDPEAMRKRGVDATDLQYSDVRQSAIDAAAEVKEAADAVTGLYDLPLLANSPAGSTGIVRPMPRAYSEASPYEWTSVQTSRVRF